VDDDCDAIIDEGVNRLNHLMQNPSNQSIVLNASSDELYLSIDLNLSEEQMTYLNLSATWWRNGQIISTNMTLFESIHDCEIGNDTLTIELCKKSGLSQPYEIILFLDDGRESVSVNWSIVYNVQLVEEDEWFSIALTNTSLFAIGLGILVVILLGVLLLQRKRPPTLPPLPPNFNLSEPYADVPAAPELRLL
jgi:hypothetical protein